MKVDPTQVLRGNFLVTMEQKTSGNLRLEYGAGLLTSFIAKPLYKRLYRSGTNVFDESIQAVKMKPGFCVYLSSKIPNNKYPWFYAGLNLLTGSYIKQLNYASISTSIGYEVKINKQWIFDAGFGVGFEIYCSLDNYFYTYKNQALGSKNTFLHNSSYLYFPLTLKLGYQLH